LVLAASSLGRVFEDLAAAFEARHPGVAVAVSAAPTPELVAQVSAGAPADLIATADVESIEVLAAGGSLRDGWSVIARNRIVLVVPAANPDGIGGLADLAAADLVLGLGHEGVPVGRYAEAVLTAEGIDVPPTAVRLRSATDVVARVADGEVDVGIAYATDVRGVPAVASIVIAEAENIDIAYPMAVLAGTPSPALAAELFAFVASTEGRSILRAHGFLSP